MTPTQRSLKLLRGEGYTVAVVESWIPKIMVRRDCFGFGDLLAFHPRVRRIVLVQTTTSANLAARVTKAKALPALLGWLESGGLVEMHGWKKADGKWVVRRLKLTAGDVDRSSIIPRAKARAKVRGLFE